MISGDTGLLRSSQGLEQVFLDTFSKYITPDDIIVLAVSGGVDSMVLFDLVKKHHPKEKIIIAHFDHSLRGVESDGDRDFIAKICKRENIMFEVEKMDIASLAKSEKMSIEMAARKYRYEFLTRVAEKYRAHYILTAHHQDDRIETMMFNLIRGTRLGGISALRELSSRHPELAKDPESRVPLDHWIASSLAMTTCTIFRPLLTVSKSAILDYAGEHHIDYREDSTNTDTTYLRNHLRHEILPEFEKINPDYRRALEGFIEYSGEVQEWIDGQIVSWLQIQSESIKQKTKDNKNLFTTFRISDFQKQSLFFQKELIRYLYEEANQGTIGLSGGLIDELIRFITEGSNSYGIREIKNLRLERRGERVIIFTMHS